MNNPMKYIDANGLWPTKKVADNGSVGNRGFSLVPVMNPFHKVSRPHKGQDFPVPKGNNIHALAEGKVSNIGYNKDGWGYYVDIKHSDGYTTRYAHLQEGGIKVKKGQEIKDGAIIALSGMTGGATGPHLHLEVLLNGKPINPMFISDLQLFLNELNSDENAVNEENPVELEEITVTAKGSERLKPIEAQVKASETNYNSPFQQGRTYPGDYFYPGSYWEAYDAVKNF